MTTATVPRTEPRQKLALMIYRTLELDGDDSPLEVVRRVRREVYNSRMLQRRYRHAMLRSMLAIHAAQPRRRGGGL